jgi:hypothetical protein
MKNSILLLLLCAAIGCTKSENNTVTVNPSPTVKDSTLVGRWLRGSAVMTIAKDVINETVADPQYRYASTADTIYVVCPDQSLAPKYGYILRNDTLFLYPTLHYPGKIFYTRL